MPFMSVLIISSQFRPSVATISATVPPIGVKYLRTHAFTGNLWSRTETTDMILTLQNAPWKSSRPVPPRPYTAFSLRKHPDSALTACTRY